MVKCVLMNHERKALRLDPTSIRFPTDSISLGRMRREEAYPLTSKSLATELAGNISALRAHRLELMLAEAAYDRELGNRVASRVTRNELVALPDDAYQRFGLSAGSFETRQLVEKFEKAASKKANVHSRSANR